MPRRLPLAFALSIATAVACVADVRWESKEVLLDLDSSQSGGEAVFRFTNDGAAPVTITGVKPGCGCTVPVLDKSEYAPGESGSLTARFSTGERRGSYHVPVHVQFGDGQVDELSLIAQIRELVKLFPLNLVWAAGDRRAPKDIELHWNTTDEVSITSIRSINSAFKAEIVPGQDWNGARIRITPAGDSTVGTSVVVITTSQGPDRRSRAYTVVARAQ